MAKDKRTDNQRKTDAVMKPQRQAQSSSRSDRPKMPSWREIWCGRKR